MNVNDDRYEAWRWKYSVTFKVMLLTILFTTLLSLAVPHAVEAAKSSPAWMNLSSNAIPERVKQVSPSIVTLVGQDRQLLDEAENPQDALIFGSGFVFRSDGWIVTNAHVVQNMQKAIVILQNGKKYDIVKVLVDADTDLALVRIQAKGLKPLKLADKKYKAQLGETVLALGTPSQVKLRNSVSIGIVSGLNRHIDEPYLFMQTDAAINPGNSGGPLINIRGEVIGVNAMKVFGEDIDSLGFAIPIDTVHWVVEDLIKYGKVKRASIGITLNEGWAASYGLPTNGALSIEEVVSSAAKKAGLATGDKLLMVSGQQVETIAEVNEALKGIHPGTIIKVKVKQKATGKVIVQKVKLGER